MSVLIDPAKFIGSLEHKLYEDDRLMENYIKEKLQQKRRLSPIIWVIHFCLDPDSRMPSLSRLVSQTMRETRDEYPFISDESLLWGRTYDKLGVQNTCGKVDPSFLKGFAQIKRMMAEITKCRIKKHRKLHANAEIFNNQHAHDPYAFKDDDSQLKWVPNPTFRFIQTEMNVFHPDFNEAMRNRRPPNSRYHQPGGNKLSTLKWSDEIFESTLEKFKMARISCATEVQNETSKNKQGEEFQCVGNTKKIINLTAKNRMTARKSLSDTIYKLRHDVEKLKLKPKSEKVATMTMSMKLYVDENNNVSLDANELQAVHSPKVKIIKSYQLDNQNTTPKKRRILFSIDNSPMDDINPTTKQVNTHRERIKDTTNSHVMLSTDLKTKMIDEDIQTKEINVLTESHPLECSGDLNSSIAGKNMVKLTRSQYSPKPLEVLQQGLVYEKSSNQSYLNAKTVQVEIDSSKTKMIIAGANNIEVQDLADPDSHYSSSDEEISQRESHILQFNSESEDTQDAIKNVPDKDFNNNHTGEIELVQMNTQDLYLQQTSHLGTKETRTKGNEVMDYSEKINQTFQETKTSFSAVPLDAMSPNLWFEKTDRSSSWSYKADTSFNRPTIDNHVSPYSDETNMSALNQIGASTMKQPSVNIEDNLPKTKLDSQVTSEDMEVECSSTDTIRSEETILTVNNGCFRAMKAYQQNDDQIVSDELDQDVTMDTQNRDYDPYEDNMEVEDFSSSHTPLPFNETINIEAKERIISDDFFTVMTQKVITHGKINQKTGSLKLDDGKKSIVSNVCTYDLYSKSISLDENGPITSEIKSKVDLPPQKTQIIERPKEVVTNLMTLIQNDTKCFGLNRGHTYPKQKEILKPKLRQINTCEWANNQKSTTPLRENIMKILSQSKNINASDKTDIFKALEDIHTTSISPPDNEETKAFWSSNYQLSDDSNLDSRSASHAEKNGEDISDLEDESSNFENDNASIKSLNLDDEIYHNQQISSDTQATKDIPASLNTEQFKPIKFDSPEDEIQESVVNKRKPMSEIMRLLQNVSVASTDSESITMPELLHGETSESAGSRISKSNVEITKNSKVKAEIDDILCLYGPPQDFSSSSSESYDKLITAHDLTDTSLDSLNAVEFDESTNAADESLESTWRKTPPSVVPKLATSWTSRTPRLGYLGTCSQERTPLKLRRIVIHSDESTNSQSPPMELNQGTEKRKQSQPERGASQSHSQDRKREPRSSVGSRWMKSVDNILGDIKKK